MSAAIIAKMVDGRTLYNRCRRSGLLEGVMIWVFLLERMELVGRPANRAGLGACHACTVPAVCALSVGPSKIAFDQEAPSGERCAGPAIDGRDRRRMEPR